MIEFLVPLSSAVFVSLRNVLIRTVRKNVAHTTVLFVNFLVAAVAGVVVAVVVLPMEVGSRFYWSVPIVTVALIVGRFALIAGISSATLSSTVPLIAFAPLFISLTSFLILGERITLLGFGGILAVVVGSYLLRIDSAGGGVLEPIRVLSREKGARMMLLAALCFSIAAPMAKIAVRASSPYLAFAGVQILGFVLVTGWVASRRHLSTAVAQIVRNPAPLLLVGVANVLQALTTYLAIDLMLVAYALGIKGSNILMTGLLGHIVFHEKKLGRTILVGLIMVAGVALLAFD